jgi:acyl-coenzyme A thioesterase 9
VRRYLVLLNLQVDVGNLLRFKACVLYTEVERADRPLIHIEVVAYVTQPEVSNTFHFTFSLDPNFLKTSTISAVRRVLPASEEEARACLARYDADHLGKYPFLPK